MAQGGRQRGEPRLGPEGADGQGTLFAVDNPVDDGTAGYRVPTALSAAGITYRQLDYWARTGLVTPSVRDATGSGSSRLYSFRDILVLRLVKKLLDAGVSLQNVRTAVEHLRARGVDDLAQLTLVSDGTTVYECSSADEIIDLVHGGQAVFTFVPVASTFSEVRGTLADLPVEPVDATTQAVAQDELARRRARRRASA